MNELVGPQNIVRLYGTTYYKDWDGSWYFVVNGRVYHVGHVLSDFAHSFHSKWGAELFLNNEGWKSDRKIVHAPKPYEDISPIEWKAVEYLCTECMYIFIAS